MALAEPPTITAPARPKPRVKPIEIGPLVEPFKKGRKKYLPITGRVFDKDKAGLFGLKERKYACAFGAIAAGRGKDIERRGVTGLDMIDITLTKIQSPCDHLLVFGVREPPKETSIANAVIHLNDDHKYTDSQMIEFLTRVEAGEFTV